MLLACQHWFVVNSAMPRTGFVRSLGGVAAPVVFDTGLVWSASCKENLGSSSPLLIKVCFDWANLVDLVPLFINLILVGSLLFE